MLKSPPIFTDIKDYKELSIKKGDISVAFFSYAPIIDESCSYNSMIEYKIIKKIKD
jgi:hypothetical protein